MWMCVGGVLVWVLEARDMRFRLWHLSCSTRKDEGIFFCAYFPTMEMGILKMVVDRIARLGCFFFLFSF